MEFKKYLVGYFVQGGGYGSAVVTSSVNFTLEVMNMWNEALSKKHGVEINIFTFKELESEETVSFNLEDGEGFGNNGDSEDQWIEKQEAEAERDYYEKVGKALAWASESGQGAWVLIVNDGTGSYCGGLDIELLLRLYDEFIEREETNESK